MMRVLALILLNLTLWSLPVEAQLWSGVLDPARAIDWTTAGAGPIPTNRTQCGSTIAPGASAATINAAIAACPAGQFVNLGAGTFNLSDGIVFSGKDNVTLRGAGADQTRLLFTGFNACGGKASHVCVIPSSFTQYFPESAGTTANWTSGFAKGTTSIVVDSKTNLQIGSTIVLHQLNDNGDPDPGTDVYDCSTVNVCTQAGDPASPQSGMYQFVTVTSISGGACPCTIGITPGVYMPNWRQAKNPQASWASGIYITGVGIENLSVEHVSSGNFNIAFFNAKNSWLKGIRSTVPISKHVLNFMSHHITVRDSYFSNVTPPCANDHYGYDGYISSDNLIENNIFERMEVPLMNEQAQQGNVFGYNYTVNNNFSSSCSPTDWMQASSHDHGKGNAFVLAEGNDANGAVRENYFGPSFFMTEFRNRYAGWEPTGLETNQTVPIHNYGFGRFHNYIGNILGTSGYHTQYQTKAGDPTANCNTSIYAIGLGGNCDNGNGAPWPINDLNTYPSILRWGNCDVVTGMASCRFVSTEVPSGITKYRNPVPASNNLPASFYLNARPAWWNVGATTPAWPPIGPDVTGGDVTGSGQSVNAGLNGRVYKIPARLCYENVMGGTFANSTTVKTFNANLCYPTTGGNTTPPAAPTGLKVQ